MKVDDALFWEEKTRMIVEEIRKAYKALESTYRDDCDGCKYMDKYQYKMPCLICRKSHQNMYQGGENCDE